MKTRYTNNNLAAQIGLLILFVLASLLTRAETKYAIIVGIGEQPASTQWAKTSGDKDAFVMKESLAQRDFDSLIILTNEQATKKNVVNALNQAVQSLTKGDIFVFHYAGHGQQIADDNNEDIDGLDEALVLYGAPSQYDRWYNFEHHLRDDEFSEIVDRLRAKLGDKGEVLIVTDAGFGQKSNMDSVSIRGGVHAFVSEEFSQAGRYMDISAGIYEDRPFGMPSMSAAPIVMISASLSHLTAFEFEGNGALTRAFERAMEQYTIKTTYEDLYKIIRDEFVKMNIIQLPIIEGFYDIRTFRNATVSAMSIDWNRFSNSTEDTGILSAHKNRELQKHIQELKTDEPFLRSLF